MRIIKFRDQRQLFFYSIKFDYFFKKNLFLSGLTLQAERVQSGALLLLLLTADFLFPILLLLAATFFPLLFLLLLLPFSFVVLV